MKGKVNTQIISKAELERNQKQGTLQYQEIKLAELKSQRFRIPLFLNVSQQKSISKKMGFDK